MYPPPFRFSFHLPFPDCFIQRTPCFQWGCLSSGISVHRQIWAVPACWAGCGDWNGKGMGGVEDKELEGEWAFEGALSDAFCLAGFRFPAPPSSLGANPGLVCCLDHSSSHSIPTLSHSCHMLGSIWERKHIREESIWGRKQFRSQGA